ncbi:MAG: hypothetical protein PHO63_02375 [Bacilli bacterium]|nr:hypothetical protein [Bacilli bacterium]MDD4809480.1 hypothetical protein [Bacilli bacterium]
MVTNSFVGKIEIISQKQMIRNMLERIFVKHNNVLSESEKSDLQNDYFNNDKDYDSKLQDLYNLHALNGEEIKQYLNKSPNADNIQRLNDFKEDAVLNNQKEASQIEEPQIVPLEKPKVLVLNKNNNRY